MLNELNMMVIHMKVIGEILSYGQILENTKELIVDGVFRVERIVDEIMMYIELNHDERLKYMCSERNRKLYDTKNISVSIKIK